MSAGHREETSECVTARDPATANGAAADVIAREKAVPAEQRIQHQERRRFSGRRATRIFIIPIPEVPMC
jgi:hypothetical protein